MDRGHLHRPLHCDAGEWSEEWSGTGNVTEKQTGLERELETATEVETELKREAETQKAPELRAFEQLAVPLSGVYESPRLLREDALALDASVRLLKERCHST